MGSLTTFCVLLAACYAILALKCKYCKDISEEPNCSHPEEIECSPSHTHCLNMVLHLPAYGVIQRCAYAKECSSMTMPEHLVDSYCCSTDLCN